MDLKHLETFRQVADLRSFSKAGDELFLTQPTISGHVLLLEKSLGLRLFDRTGRQVHLTKAGNVLYHYASKMLALRKEALNALSEFSLGIKGELSLGASTLPGEYLLPKLLAEFKNNHPHLTISLRIADTKDIVQSVLQGSVEFVVTGAKLKHPSLQYELLGEDEIIVVVSPLLVAKRGKTICFEELLDEPWILRENGSGTQMAVEEALRKKDRSLKHLRNTVEMGSTSALKEGVKAGLGFAFVSEKAVAEELNQGLLSRVVVEGMEPISRKFYIVSNRQRTLSPIGTKFLRYLRTKKEIPTPFFRIDRRK